MNTIKYHFVNPKLRKEIDLRDFEREIEQVTERFPVRLDKVKSDYCQITILTDTKKNKIVRELGRQLAKTSLRVFARSKKGKRKSNELFRQKKS
jgi:hypothetical protein